MSTFAHLDKALSQSTNKIEFSYESEFTPDSLSKVITEDHFGTRYTAFKNIDRFLDQTSEFDGGLIVWPGGSLAERSSEKYGLEYDGMWNSEDFPDRPDLYEMLQISADLGKTLSIVLPTSRYSEDPDEMVDGLWDLFESILLDFGSENLPRKVIFEVGNEYYANFLGSNEIVKAENYGKIANIIGETVSDIDHSFGGLSNSLQFSFQAGRTSEAMQAIIEQLSSTSLAQVDMISHHRFSPRLDAVTKSIPDLENSLIQWQQAVGDDDLAVFLSAYNISSLARPESYLDYLKSIGQVGENQQHEIAFRSNTDFEKFYQNQLDARSVGIQHAEVILKLFSEYSALGLEAASVYGWDLIHGGRSSFNDADGESHVFAAGVIQDMMAESLIGTSQRDVEFGFEDDPYHDLVNSYNSSTSIYQYENDDKAVIFLTSTNVVDDEVLALNIDDFPSSANKIWVEKMSLESHEGWMEDFGIIDNLDVEESAEEKSYASVIRETITPEFSDGYIILPIPNDQIIRISVAKSNVGSDEIASWHPDPENYLDIKELDVEFSESDIFDYDQQAPNFIEDAPEDKLNEEYDSTLGQVIDTVVGFEAMMISLVLAISVLAF